MPLQPPTATAIALSAFVYDLVAQSYGMLATPNMKTINDRNLSFFSPQPFMIAGFFLPQQIFQVMWLYRLVRLSRKGKSNELSEAGRKRELDLILDYVPCYAVGNVCIGTWMFFWNKEMLKTSDLFVVVNTLTQVFYLVARLPKMNTASRSSVLTHVVSKAFAGIGVLDILHNTSIAYFKDDSAGFLLKVLTGVGFGLGSAASDWMFGACLAYDLVALALGQWSLDSGWSTLLGVYAVGAAGITAVKNYFK